MTPGYVSPEVIESNRASTAADVYSLGVVLYQLLSGLLPHEVGDVSLAVALERVRTSEPLPPSRRISALANEDGSRAKDIARQRHTDPNRLSATLRGDIDNILLKALAIEPARRYRSAQQLGDDVKRYLEHRPVGSARAHPPIHVRKFVRRHRWPVAFAVLAVAALTTVTALTARYALDIGASDGGGQRAAGPRRSRLCFSGGNV